MVGPVLSNLTPMPVVVAETLVPEFPSESVNLIVKASAPAVSLELAIKEAVQAVAEVLAMVSGPAATSTPPKVLVAVKVERFSLEVICNVIVSPGFARLELALVEDADTVERVGRTLSITRLVESMPVDDAVNPEPLSAKT